MVFLSLQRIKAVYKIAEENCLFRSVCSSKKYSKSAQRVVILSIYATAQALLKVSLSVRPHQQVKVSLAISNT